MENIKLNFTVLKGTYGVCRLDKDERIPDWVFLSDFYTISRTPDELSIVCSQEKIAEGIKCEEDWKVFKVEGILDFSLTGILAAISRILANARISIFAISTFDTDYVLVRDTDFKQAVSALNQAGYGVKIGDDN